MFKNTLVAFLSTFIVASASSTVPAFANSKSNALPFYIQALANDGAQVHHLGDELGLQGWLVVKNGVKQYVYATPNQQAYIIGILVDKNGDLVTNKQIERFLDENPSYLQEEALASRARRERTEKILEDKIISRNSPTPEVENIVSQAPVTPEANKKPDVKIMEKSSVQPKKDSPSEQLFAQIQEAHWVEIGSSSAPIVYAFVDPECPHCHQFITDLREQKTYDKGEIRTRLLPVGIMGNDSLYEAAKLIESKSPRKDFFDHLDGDEFALAVDTSLDTKKVQDNMAIMQEWNLDVTPFIIYRDKENAVKIVRGRPKDLPALINDLK